MATNSLKGKINPVASLDFLKQLFSKESPDPLFTYETAIEYLNQLAACYNCFIQISILSKNGYVVLPLLSLPPKIEPEEKLRAEITTVTSIGANLKKTTSRNGLQKSWLVQKLLDIEGPAHFTKTGTKTIKLKEGSENTTLVQYSYQWRKSVHEEKFKKQNSVAKLILPMQMKEGHPYARILDEFYAYAIIIPAQPGAAELILFAIFSTWSTSINLNSNLDSAKEFALRSTGFPLALLSYKIAGEIRSQISSSNPHHICRYFQIKLGEKCIKKILRKQKLGKEDEFFFKKILIHNKDSIVVRRILRSLSKEKECWSILKKKINNWSKRAWLLEYMKDLSNGKAKTSNILSTISKQKRSAKKQGKCILIASSRGGVGKTLNGLLLANYLSKNGKKSCFLELDIASPTIFYLSNKLRNTKRDPILGLSEVYADSRRDGLTAKSIKEFLIEEKNLNIDFIGAHPPKDRDDTAYYLSRGFSTGVLDDFAESLISGLKSIYNWVLVDTSAGFRDLTLTLAKHEIVDLTLVFSISSKAAILNAVDNLIQGNINIPHFLILNCLRTIDRDLYGSKEGVYDFIFQDEISQKSNDKIDIISRVGKKLANCHDVYPIGWDEALARIDEIRDLRETVGAMRDIAQIADAIREIFTTKYRSK